MVTIAPLPAPTAEPRPTVAAALRFDGVYVAQTDDVKEWMRFYPDGTGVAASSSTDTTIDNVAVWMVKGHDGVGDGSYSLRGSTLTFSETTEGYGTVHHAGTVEGTTLRLHWHSDINGADGDRSYTFEPLPR